MFKFSIRNAKTTLRFRLIFLTVMVLFMVSSCSFKSPGSTHDSRHCLDRIPGDVKGLSIVSGPRSKPSIIRDMVPVMCNGQILFDRMQLQDPGLNPGPVVFRVVVEYTGEVAGVDIKEASIPSDAFIKKIAGFIMDTDFVSWAPGEEDTVFIYPAKFGG